MIRQKEIGLKEDQSFLMMPKLSFQRKNNPEYIQKLLKYDRPDIILVKEGIPKLVIEKTREVPYGS